MARIFHIQGAAQIALNGEEFFADEHGGFDVPSDVADVLLTHHTAGEPSWETDGARIERLAAEDHAKRADPANLLAAVERLGGFATPGDPTPGETAAEKRAQAERLIAEAEAAEVEQAARDAAEATKVEEAAAEAARVAEAEEAAKVEKASAAAAKKGSKTPAA